ncbi:copper-binding protein [Ramlibacter sp.]|uniref:copper-binding protein n=1 Tax=Ramlibacter sp. TaxID=1917967 RepID=UPI002B71F2C2|nr:copper-binding protein [Ramlibacter sp.]HWI84075.1 copper-binding protein [Ramlibacter sp.]
MRPPITLLLPLFWFALGPAPAAAQAPSPQPREAAAAANFPLARGEVLEIDRAERRLTIKHGRIESLGMDPMTMEFLVRDEQLLARVQPGDKVRFAAVWQGGEYFVTRIEPAKARPDRR